MDPDATLTRIRDLIHEGRTALDPEARNAARVNACDAFEDLDKWLSNGGFLPAHWTPKFHKA